LSQGDYNVALIVAQDAVNIAEGNELEEAENYVKLLNIRIDLAQNEKTIFDIDAQQEQIIRNMPLLYLKLFMVKSLHTQYLNSATKPAV